MSEEMIVRKSPPKNASLWFVSLPIFIVIISNLTAAIPYVLYPANFRGAFELNGIPGTAAVAGIGVLFVMWQVPYFFAGVDPLRNKKSLVEAILMQTIGLIGEIWILSNIDANYLTLRNSIWRFILFDAVGLVLLLTAFLLLQYYKREFVK